MGVYSPGYVKFGQQVPSRDYTKVPGISITFVIREFNKVVFVF